MADIIQLQLWWSYPTSLTVVANAPFTYMVWEYAYCYRQSSTEINRTEWYPLHTGEYGSATQIITINNLLQNSPYDIKVRARARPNDPLAVAESNVLTCTTAKDPNSEPIIFVSTEDITDRDAILYIWSESSPYYNHWQIAYVETPVERNWQPLPPANHGQPTLNDSLRFRLTGLTPDTTYRVKVRRPVGVDNDGNYIYNVSDPLIFTTDLETWAIGLSAKVLDDRWTLRLSIDPYGVSYHSWSYKIDNNDRVSFDHVGTTAFDLDITGLSADTVYSVEVQAINESLSTKHSIPVLVYMPRASGQYNFSIDSTWKSDQTMSFHITFNDGRGTSDYTDWKYSTEPNASASDDSKWTAFTPNSTDDFDIRVPSPANGQTSLDDDTYYTIRIKAQMIGGAIHPTISNVQIVKTDISPVSYDVTAFVLSLASTSVQIRTSSLFRYRIWEYSIALNPTSSDWITITENADPYLNDYYQYLFDFTISNLISNTAYPLRVRCKESASSPSYTYSDRLTFTTVKDPISIYTPPKDCVLHETEVDFVKRLINKPIRIVQYDDCGPIVAVSLYKNGDPFVIPDTENTRINIRFGKPDHTFVYNGADGISEDRTIVYFTITKQMTVFDGIFNPIVEYMVGNEIAGSGSFEIHIDRNPIQNGDIESSVEYKTVQEYAEEAQHAAEMFRNVSADAEELPQHAPAYANYDPNTGIFHFGLPAGGDGGVESVNGKTGVVEITADDIPYDSDPAITPQTDSIALEFEHISGSDRVLNQLAKNNGMIISTGEWRYVTSSSYRYIIIPVSGGESIQIIGNSSLSMYYAALRSYTSPSNNDNADFSTETGWTSRKQVNTNASISTVLPSDARYFYIQVLNNNNDSTPQKIVIDNYEITASTLADALKKYSDVNTDNLHQTIEMELASNVQNAKIREINLFAEDGILAPVTWELGTISDSSGIGYPILNYATNTKQRTVDILQVDVALTVRCDPNYYYQVFMLDQNGNLESKAASTFTSATFIIPAKKPFRIAVGPKDNTDVSDIDITQYISVKFESIKDILYSSNGVKWAAMGDSITEGYYSYLDDNDQPQNAKKSSLAWATKVSEINKWDLTNLGIGGTGWLDPAGSDNKTAYTIARDADLTGYNLITLAYGINDWKGNQTLGTINDDSSVTTPTTVLQSMKKTIETILYKNPTCKIIGILPINSCRYGTKSVNWSLGTENTQQKTLEEFVQAMINVYEYYGIQYIDMTHGSIVNRENIETLLIDGVHPSEVCHALMADELCFRITFKR